MNSFSLLFLILCLSSLGATYKMVVFVPSIANSQVQFGARFAETLASGGHDVTVVLESFFSDFKTDVKLANGVKTYVLNAFVEGATKAQWERDSAKTMFSETGISDIPDVVRMFGGIFNMMNEGCRESIRNEKFMKWLKSEQFDVAFASVATTCDIGLIHAAGMPTWAWYSSGPLADHMAKTVGVPIVPSYVPPIMMEATDEMGFAERVKSFIGHAITIPLYRWSVADVQTSIFREELKDPHFPNTLELASKVPLVIVNTNEIYDLPRPSLAKVVNIGGLGVGFDSAKPLTGEIKKISETGKGLIIFSFGSVAGAHEMPLHWKNSLLAAFSTFPDYQFVMRYVKDDLNDRLPKNMHLFKWLPQKDLLLHNNTKAFITHGGYNSMQEAISAGTPLVTIALGGDQPKNSRIAFKRGFAVNIAKSTISKETIVDALREVLTNPKYKRNAQRLSDMVRVQPEKPAQRLLRWAEFLAEFKTLEIFEPAGMKLNSVQYHSLDVIGFLLSIFCLVSLIGFKVLKWLVAKMAEQTMATMEDFLGRWRMVKSENFEEFMKEIGVGFITRKAAAHLKPTLEVTRDGDTWHWNQYSTFKDTKLEFQLGVEFLDHSPDDKDYMSTLTFEDGKLVHRQNKIKESDHSSVFTSWIENGKLYSTYQSGNVICTREYERE